MPKQKPLEVITPPNVLKAKVGGALPKLDNDAIARAEAAMDKLAHQFDDWMRDEVEKLEAAFSNVAETGLTSDDGDSLYRRAHDIKGLAATYRYPLVTRIAASFCRLIETPELRESADADLVRAHVEAIRAAVRDDVRTDDHPVGKMLAGELENRVDDAVAA